MKKVVRYQKTALQQRAAKQRHDAATEGEHQRQFAAILAERMAEVDAESGPKCPECGMKPREGVNCKTCGAIRLAQNQPDERTRQALARGNRDLDY